MSTSRIDANNKNTWIAYDESTGTIENVVVDPVLNSLLVYVVTADGNVPTTLNTAKIDANQKATALGYNETTGLVEALRCGTNGELLIFIE